MTSSGTITELLELLRFREAVRANVVESGVGNGWVGQVGGSSGATNLMGSSGMVSMPTIRKTEGLKPKNISSRTPPSLLSVGEPDCPPPGQPV